MTYPNDEVIAYIHQNFVPVKLLGADNRELTKGFNVRWFPGIVVAGADRRATHVSIGFLPPEDLISELDFGRAIHAMTTRDYELANELFDRLASTDADRSPEATYWWGISRMRETKDPGAGTEKWKLIPERWPATQWARKVEYALAER